MWSTLSAPTWQPLPKSWANVKILTSFFSQLGVVKHNRFAYNEVTSDDRFDVGDKRSDDIRDKDNEFVIQVSFRSKLEVNPNWVLKGLFVKNINQLVSTLRNKGGDLLLIC